MKGITVDMTGIVFFLLLTGVVFMVGSFFITERLSPSELNKITELSKDELGRIIDGALADAKSKVEESMRHRLMLLQNRWRGHWKRNKMKKHGHQRIF